MNESSARDPRDREREFVHIHIPMQLQLRRSLYRPRIIHALVENRLFVGPWTNEDEIFIALIGPSGSGKTSFIHQLKLMDHSLNSAAYRFNNPTSRITATTVGIQGVNITLLDTPGIGSFVNGRVLSEYDIFRLVRNWLRNTRRNAHLTGILYFQNTDDKRPTRPDIDYFSGICEANNFYSSVVLVATELGRKPGGGWAKLREYEANLWREAISLITHQRTKSW
ncbi:hypothetical protein EDC04DRAFT_88119 [Pisolithus marmoratus]|nr:hypothetical protein EDC04DRAFT_88119 [Pisolithus marmoratus]